MMHKYLDQKNLKLHLGCGADHWDGYVNIDLDPVAKADLHLNVLDLAQEFSANSVAEAIAFHALNYLSLWEAREFFKIMSKLLQPGGRLILETANLERLTAKIQDSQGNLAEYLEGVRALHGFGLDHMEAQAAFTPNKFSWTPWHLRYELEQAGFSDVRILPAQSHAPWRDMRVEATRAAATASESPVSPVASGRRVLFLLYYPMGSITMRIRGLIFEPYLRAQGWQVSYMDVAQHSPEQIVEAAAQHDVVYALKVPFLDLYLRLKTETNAKLIFDLTDALWQAHHRHTGWQQLEMILALVDGVFCDNPFVAAYGSRFNQNVKVIPACTQVERFMELRAGRPARNDGRLRIGWVGTHGTLQSLQKLAGPLARLSLRHPALEVRILCLNYQNTAPIDLPGVAYSVRPDYDETAMIEEILDLDIGIFPAPFDLDDYAIRGPLKTLLYMSGGLSTVSEAAGVCAELIEDGGNGMLARSIEEWEERLDRLLSDAALRQRMGQAALATVLDRNSLAAVSAKLEECLAQISDQAVTNPTASFFSNMPAALPVQPRQESGRPRLLLACDFFWPSIGGVETIVANLGEALIALGYDVNVAARALPNRTTDQYRGMRILSLDAATRLPDGSVRASQQLRDLIEGGGYRGVIMRADPLNWVIWGMAGTRVPAGTRVLVQPLINQDGYSSWKDNQGFRQALKHVLGSTQVVCLTTVGPDKRYLDEEGIAYVHLPNASTRAVPDVNFRKAYQLDADRPLLVQVANLWPVKNHLALLDTLREVAGNWQLVLIGHPSGHADYVTQVRAAVQRDSRVRLIEGLPATQVAAAMQAADLLLLPSLGEVSPVSIIESMSHGLPWLATPECGAANEASGGFIAPLGDFPHLIDRLLGDAALRRELGELGQQHWSSCNQWEVVARGWRDLVERGELLQPPQAPQEVLQRMRRLREEIGCLSPVATGKAGASGALPLVSVIIPTQNRPDLLIRAVRSVKAQTYPNVEIVVVNDGGVDVDSLLKWLGADANITSIRFASSQGVCAARNAALRAAHGDIIAYLDDDDVFLPNHVQVVVNALKREGVKFVYTRSLHVLETLEHGQYKELGRGAPYGNMQYSRERLFIGNYIPINTWAHWKSCVDQVGYFDESLDNHEDWDFLLRCSLQFDLVHVPEDTVEVRNRRESDNAMRRHRHKFLDAYHLLYARYGDLGSDLVVRGRQHMLRSLSVEGEPSAALIVKTEEFAALEHARQEYRAWRSKRSLQEIDAQLFAERMMLQWKVRPQFHIVLTLQPGEESLLADTLDSLGGQLYPDWWLTVIAPVPAPDPAFNEVEQLRWIEVHSAADRAAAVNGLATGGEAQWLWFLPAGAGLEPHALVRCGDYINLRSDWRLIYSDDDRVNTAGEFDDPRFKPDFNLDLLRSADYVGPFLLRADGLAKAGGYSTLEGAETYDMALRVLDCYGEQAIGHIEDVLAHLPSQWMSGGGEENARRAVADHLGRQGIKGEVVEGYAAGTHRVIYERPADPLISIIIPNRDKLEFLQPCVESLLEKTTYQRYELLIVDNQSADPDVLDYYDELMQRQPGVIRVLSYDAAFNFSAMNNLAAREARGEYLLLLNNDTQIVQGDWMERLLNHGQRPEVGVVGARCVYPEAGKLQHAGVLLGMGGIADHPFIAALSLSEAGYMNRAQVDQDYSAVTAACMLVRKSVWDKVGGMDEIDLKVLFNDVDFCLKVRKAGHKTVWTPYATVVHHGSTSVKEEAADMMKLALNAERIKREQATMMRRWLPALANDPAYNRHLTLQLPAYRVEGTVVIDWDTNFHDRPRILGTPLSGGAGEYRMIAPFRALSRAGLAQCDVVQAGQMFKTRILMPVEVERAKPDTLVLHAAIDDKQREALELYKQFNPEVLRIFTLDDLLGQIPKQNSFYRFAFKDAKPRLRKALALCDRAIVTTEPLAELCRSMIGDVRLLPNRLERAVWGDVQSMRRQGNRPRVGWAGAQQHAGDLALIAEVVRATAQEVDWIFLGMCPEELRPYVAEFHDFVLSFYDYPAKLASLNLDLAVAPLEIHPFNEAKSNLRLLEYGIMGWPVVCTDIYPYQNAPVKRVANEAQAWIDAIRERVHDLDAAEREGDQLKAWVLQNFMLEDHLDEWMRALVR